MLASKDRKCDCCGKLIPYVESKVHTEYENHVAHCPAYKAPMPGNPCRWFSDNDKIFGLVEFHMFRDSMEHTVTPMSSRARCYDICPDCMIDILRKTIAHIEKCK